MPGLVDNQLCWIENSLAGWRSDRLLDLSAGWTAGCRTDRLIGWKADKKGEELT